MNPTIRMAALGLALTALVPSPSPAQVYKWVDERGVTHYGEKPPANKGQPLTLRDPTGGSARPPAPAVKAEGNLQEQERDFQRRQLKRNQEAEAARKELERQNSPAAQRARITECQRATRDLSVIRSNPTTFTFAEESRVKDSISRNCP